MDSGVLSEGIMSLEKVGTHHNPSDVLTKFVQASVSGQHLPKLNLLKDHSLSQVFKYCSGVEKVKIVDKNHAEIKEAHCSDQRLARLCQQVCGQHQGQVCMINFEAIQDQQDLMIQQFGSASIRIRRAFTPPPRRGSDHSDHSGEDIEVQMPLQRPDVGQDVRNVHHVTHALHSAVLSVRQWDGHESKADHSRVCECQSGQDNHRSKETTGSKKESIILITSVSIFVYLRPVQYPICYMCFHCSAFHVIQSILISIILSDSRLELSASLASAFNLVVSFSCHPHFKNGGISGNINLNSSTSGW